MNFNTIIEFEKEVANFFGAPYAVAVDSCTHGIELSIRYLISKETIVPTIYCPKRTYLSVPMLANKLGLELHWTDEEWQDLYCCFPRVFDAAVLWKKDSYISGTFMCLSFQYQKHLSLGRGGMILCDNEADAKMLKKMSYDGRLPDSPWREQDIDTMGYHYYMTPETAQMGLDKLKDAIETPPRQWVVTDWPDLTQMKIFK
jgi:dTDP-4-amino-4,6-dideoxygalactose transaminase